LRDTINITRQEKDITTVSRNIFAEIKSSLWGAMEENNMNSAVAIELAEVYAWTIDFFELQKGDYFITELTCNFSGFTDDSSEKSAFCSNRYKYLIF
jgi:hypothetical protein